MKNLKTLLMLLAPALANSLFTERQFIAFDLLISSLHSTNNSLTFKGTDLTVQKSYIYALNLPDGFTQKLATVRVCESVQNFWGNNYKKNTFALYAIQQGINLRLVTDTETEASIFRGKILGDPVFGESWQQLFWLGHNYQSSIITLYRYNAGQNTWKILGQIQQNSRIIFSNKQIYLLKFSQGILSITTYNQNLSHTSHLQFPIGNLDSFSFSAKIVDNTLGVNFGDLLFLYQLGDDLEEWVQIYSEDTGGAKIQDFLLMKKYVVITTEDDKVYAYGIGEKVMLDTQETSGSRLSQINDTHFVSWSPGCSIIQIGGVIPDDPLNAATYFRNNWNSSYSNFLGATMKLSSLKSIFKFLAPINCFFQQFWLYDTHNTEYPQFFKLFTEEIDLINYLKLQMPFEIEFPEEYIEWSLEMNLKYKQASGRDKFENLYYMSVFPSFLLNALMNLLMFLFLWAFIVLVYQVSKIIPRARTFKSALQKRSHFFVLIINIIESNLFILAFQLTLQSFATFAFDFQQKEVLLLPIFFFFLIVIYCLTGYLLIHSYRPSIIHNALTIGDSSYKGYTIQIILLLILKITKACIHCALINNYSYQIISLCLVHGLAIVCIIYYRRNFMDRFFYWANLLYYTTIFLINLLLLVRFRWLMTDEEIKYNCECLLIILLFMAMVMTFVKMVLFFSKDIFQLFCHKRDNFTKKESMIIQEQHSTDKQGVIFIMAEQVHTKPVKKQVVIHTTSLSNIGTFRQLSELDRKQESNVSIKQMKFEDSKFCLKKGRRDRQENRLSLKVEHQTTVQTMIDEAIESLKLKKMRKKTRFYEYVDE